MVLRDWNWPRMSKDFDQNKAFTAFKRYLQKQQGMEPGYVEELTSNAMDCFDDKIDQGFSEEEAFRHATQDHIGDAEALSDEFYKSRTPITDKRPPWKKKSRLIQLMPGYVKVALRNFMRKKGYTLINYVGLTVGLFTVAVVGLYIKYETSWDSFHSKSERVYRIGQKYRSQDYSIVSFDGYRSASREDQLSQVAGFEAIPGVEDVAHFWIYGGPSYLYIDGREYSQDGILSTNTPAAFFNVFDWDFLYGTAASFDGSPGKAVMTHSAAEKILGPGDQSTADLIGTFFEMDSVRYEITGVIRDIPENSHIDFQVVTSDPKIGYWGARTYALLESGADIKEVARRWEENAPSIAPQYAEDEDGLFKGFEIHNLEDIHLSADLLYEQKPPGNISYLYIFGIIAGIILLITVSNYTNLSVAMYSGRNREIAIRKVMGAERNQIAGQFLAESIILSIIALPVVILLISWLLPSFNQFMNVNLSNRFIESLQWFGMLLALATLFGLISGSYPAWNMSGKRLSDLFNTQMSRSQKGSVGLRKGLIILQFILLIGLGSATWLINKQLLFIQQKDIGYAKNGIVYVLMEGRDSYERFRSLLASEPLISEVGSGTPLARNVFNQTTYKLDGFDQIFDDGYNLYMNPAALNAYGIQTSVDDLLFESSQIPNKLILINESGAEKFARILGIEKQQLIGKTFRTEPGYTQDNGTVGFPKTIDGFFQDINMFSLKEEIDPYFLEVRPDVFGNWAIVRFNASDLSGAMQVIRETYKALGQSYPLISQFQEDRVEALYLQESRVASLTRYLSILAFAVALMGLIGLSAYLTTIRKKEIGIRKVLGANNFDLVILLNREYVWLVGLALLIAAPIAWLAVKEWLSEFAYRIEIDPLVFLLVALITLLVAFSAVTSQTLLAASKDPVQSLRNDQ